MTMIAIATDPDTRIRTTLPTQFDRIIPICGKVPLDRDKLEEQHCLCGIGCSGNQSETIEVFGVKYDFGEVKYSVKAYFSAVKDWSLDFSFNKEAVSLPELWIAVREIKVAVEMVLRKLGIPEYGGHLHISVNTTSLPNYNVLSDVVEAATKAVLNAFE
jgi:hypothetical protein